jgi:hypothetical protein
LQPLELGGEVAGLVEGHPGGLPGQDEPLGGPLGSALTERGEELQGLVGDAHVMGDTIVQLAAYALARQR